MRHNLKIIVLAAFFLGYFVNDLVREAGLNYFSSANADVANMNYFELKRDEAFKKAVMSVAEENCYTDIDSKSFETWFYCGENSRFAP
tara:strand:+ start:284 stop:547 length:264 start_codon:yes stop_codon:yes gene_type:complete